MPVKSICVYCGSKHGIREEYSQAARELAAALVSRNIRLVFGGGSIGIMGVVADAALDAGGHVVGVIPEALMRDEVVHTGVSELHVTRSMHERKTKMADLADGFIALPGGLGTLEEMFEVWTWAQLGFHNKPCGILNVAGYFDLLTAFLDQAVAEQFIKPTHRSLLFTENDPHTLLDLMADTKA